MRSVLSSQRAKKLSTLILATLRFAKRLIVQLERRQAMVLFNMRTKNAVFASSLSLPFGLEQTRTLA